MNKLIVIFLFSFSFLNGSIAFSQLIPENYDTLKLSHELIIRGNADYFGTAIQNDMLSKFIRGGNITEDIKNNSLDHHKAINRIGGIGDAEIEYRNYDKHLFKKKDWGFNVKVGYSIFAGLLYSKDLFGGIFYGNDRYQGETMDFSGTKLSYMNFQKVGIGLIDAKSKSSVTLNFYNVSDRFSGEINEAQIFQHEDGSAIDVVLDGEFEMKRNLKFNQGIGIGLDADFKIPVNWIKDRKAFIQFKVQDVGVAYMYEKQKVYSIDTSFTFTGLQINDLIGENAIFNESFDILDTLGLKSTEKNRTVLLPGYIQAAKMVDDLQDHKWQSFFGVRVYTTLLYNPYVFGGIDFKAAKWLHIGASVSYGGFGKLRGGLYAGAKFGNYSIGLSSENVMGWFSKKNSSGQSLNIRLRWAM